MENSPYPTSLTVGGYVWYHRRVFEVMVQNNQLYMIQDCKRPWRIFWIKPDQVQPC